MQWLKRKSVPKTNIVAIWFFLSATLSFILSLFRRQLHLWLLDLLLSRISQVQTHYNDPSSFLPPSSVRYKPRRTQNWFHDYDAQIMATRLCFLQFLKGCCTCKRRPTRFEAVSCQHKSAPSLPLSCTQINWRRGLSSGIDRDHMGKGFWWTP